MATFHRLLTLLFLSNMVHGSLVFLSQSGSCSYSDAFGSYEYCGRTEDICYVPNYVADPDRCFYKYVMDDYCNDIPPAEQPICNENQLFLGGDGYYKSPSGRGTCSDPSTGTSPWVVKRYPYACCDCPAGYISTHVKCNDHKDRRGDCAGCNGTGETPKGYGSSLRCVVLPPPGIDCDLVNNLAKQYAITSKAAPATNGYYHQILNLACLRSKCPHAACTDVRRFASVDSDCQNLSGDWKFEQSVFAKFATTPDQRTLTNLVVAIQALAETIQDMLLGPLAHDSSSNPSLAALYASFAPFDVKSIATLIAGSLHFMNDLAGAFSDYINGIWALACDGANFDATEAMADLTAEHNRLFKCAVVPGFNAEVANGNLPYVSGEIAKIVVPWAATMLRSWDILVASQCLQNLGKGGYSRKRQIGKGLSPADWWLPVDAGVPVTTVLRYNIRNWRQVASAWGGRIGLGTLPGLSTYMGELSGPNKTSLQTKLLSDFKIEYDSRSSDLSPAMAQIVLTYSNRTAPTAPVRSNFTGKVIAVVGPIATVRNPANEIVLINATHVLGRNMYDFPVLYKDAVAAARQTPTRPSSTDTTLMYRNANLSLSYIQSYTQNMPSLVPDSDITIFDLISGSPLQGVKFSGDASGGVFTAPLNLTNGIWAGSWSGGGMFALGLVTVPPSMTALMSSMRSTSSSTMTSRPTLTVSTTMATSTNPTTRSSGIGTTNSKPSTTSKRSSTTSSKSSSKTSTTKKSTSSTSTR